VPAFPLSGVTSGESSPSRLFVVVALVFVAGLRINHVLIVNASTHGCQHMVDFVIRPSYPAEMSPDLESLADQIIQASLNDAALDAVDSRQAALAELRFADSLRRSAERLSQTSAESARALGASWREIGVAVGGITPQGAEHRFSAAAKERRSKASKAEWAAKDRRRTPRTDSSEKRSYESERA
jgi:hypothetical protein